MLRKAQYLALIATAFVGAPPLLFGDEAIPHGPRPEELAVGIPERPASLTLPALEEIALSRSPTLAQAAARVQAARGQWVQAGLYPNPIIGYTASEIGDEGAAGQQGAFAEQQFVTAGKLGLSRRVEAAELSRVEQEFSAQRFRVLTDLRVEFYRTLVGQQRVELTKDLSAIAFRATEATDQLLKAEEVSRVDLLQAQVEFDNAQIAHVNAQNRYLAQWRRLAAVSGEPAMQPVPLVGELQVPTNGLVWEEVLLRVLAQSPQLGAARAAVNRESWAIQRARAEVVPNVDVQASSQHDNATGDEIVGVQVGIPLPIFNRNQGNIQSAQARLVVARTEVSRLELALQSQLAAAFERYANARNQVEQYANRIIPNARRSLDLVNEGYRVGEFNFLTLLTAQRTYSQTNLAYLASLEELWQSTMVIDGLLLTGSLQEGSSAAE